MILAAELAVQDIDFADTARVVEAVVAVAAPDLDVELERHLTDRRLFGDGFEAAGFGMAAAGRAA